MSLEDEEEKKNLVLLLGMMRHTKSRREKQLVLLEKLLLKYPIFEKMASRNGPSALRQVSSSLVVATYEQDQIIYKMPEDTRKFNFIITGSAYLYAQDDSGMQHRLFGMRKRNVQQLNLYKKVYQGEYFGERVFIDGRGTMIVCAVAAEHTVVIQLSLSTLLRVFEGIFPFKERDRMIEMLRNVHIFSTIPAKKIESILQNSTRKRFQKGHVFFQQGSMPDYLIVIIDGEITLRKTLEITQQNGQASITKTFDISILSKYDALGMKEIIDEKPYFSTGVCTSEAVQILQIECDKAKFIMTPYSLKLLLDRDKSAWRKKRISLLQSSATKTISNNSPCKAQDKIQITPQQIAFSFEDRQKLSLVQNRRRPRHQLKLDRLKKPPLSDAKSFHSLQSRESSKDLLYKYMQNKSKKDQKLLLKYAYKPPDKQQDPQKSNSVMKPLYVKKSQAIKNTMRQIRHSRKHIYSYMLRLSETLD